MNARKCKQCGEIKPIERFRQYYGDRKGHYTVCLDCEQINNRAKYLRRKGERMNYAEEAELSKIEKLYEAQRAVGLQPPHDHAGRKAPIVDSLDDMISKYTKQAEEIKQLTQVDNLPAVPEELAKWLTEPLTEEPEYYQEEVYDRLSELFRPVLRIDATSLLPVYDDTYKAVLNKILERFDEYEDAYYDKE